MLNTTSILEYIKSELGFPVQFVELSDEEIINHVSTYTLKEFARYFPDENTIALNLGEKANKVANKANEYYITDPDGREIYNVAHVYFSQSSLIMFGHPPIGPMSLGELSNWAYQTEIAGWLKSFSSWNYTTVFKHPNIISIRPTPTSEGWITVEYEREHATDFSTISNEFSMLFTELALADIMIRIGRIRKKYSAGGNGIATPFGNIPLDDSIGDEGKEKKASVIEKLESGKLMNVVVSFG